MLICLCPGWLELRSLGFSWYKWAAELLIALQSLCWFCFDVHYMIFSYYDVTPTLTSTLIKCLKQWQYMIINIVRISIVISVTLQIKEHILIAAIFRINQDNHHLHSVCPLIWTPHLQTHQLTSFIAPPKPHPSFSLWLYWFSHPIICHLTICSPPGQF